MKKFIVLLLTACLILGALTGCGKSALEEYNDSVAKFSRSDQKFKMELEVEGEGVSIGGIDGAESLKLILDGSVSGDGKMAEMVISLNIPSVQATIELTDIIVEENNMYINGQKLINALSGIVGLDDITGTIMGEKTYIMMDMGELVDTDAAELPEDSGLATFVKNISDIYGKILKDHDAASKDGSSYLLKLDSTAIEEFLYAIIDDVKENKSEYYDAIFELYTDEFLESVGLSRDDLTAQKEEILDDLDDILDEVKGDLENADFSKSAYTSKVNSTSMESTLDFIMGEELNLKFSYSAEKAAMDSVTAPTDYILWSEFEEALNSLNDYSSGIYGDEDDDTPADNEEFSFNTVTEESLSQTLGADLTGYANLTNYSLISDISGVKYNVPVINGDLHEGTGSIYSSSDNGGVYLSHYTWDLYGDEFLAFCEEDLRDTYDFYGEYGMPASFSDAYVSADGNTVVMAIAYDMGDDYIVTEVYVFQYINEEEVLYGMIEIYNGDLDDTDTAILSQYSELLGFDLSGFLNLYEKANASLI